MSAEYSTGAIELPKPELIGHLLSNQGILLKFWTDGHVRFAAVAVTGEGETKPIADRTMAAAADLAVHMDRLGDDGDTTGISSTSSISRIRSALANVQE